MINRMVKVVGGSLVVNEREEFAYAKIERKKAASLLLRTYEAVRKGLLKEAQA